MNILKDYIAYARSYVNPKLSEEAAQYLIQAYVGKIHNLAVSLEDFAAVFMHVLFLWIMMENCYQICKVYTTNFVIVMVVNGLF